MAVIRYFSGKGFSDLLHFGGRLGHGNVALPMS
jgi:hypothetical protein